MGCCVVEHALLGSKTVGNLSLTAALQITPCAATAAAALRTVVACVSKHKCWVAACGFACIPPGVGFVEDPKHAACLCCTAITWPNCHVSCEYAPAAPDGRHEVHRQLAQA